MDKESLEQIFTKKILSWLVYIETVTGMLMLSTLYLITIFNLQIYIMLKLLVSRQLKRRDYKWWPVFIYTAVGAGVGRERVRGMERKKEEK